jgi:hypothetical protein
VDASPVIYRIHDANTGVMIDTIGRLARAFRCRVSEFFREYPKVDPRQPQVPTAGRPTKVSFLRVIDRDDDGKDPK